ncbi:hypothetical protein B296_00019931 [Ensete ventricosum]|uniref:Uncharacterized protein n=1 Tax=Ensete ventricosum TaxID=4639 RepID=A0A426ZT10_ENSVE|nr:hypothetical protein B296_00019931 [Ensete ventricosum]
MMWLGTHQECVGSSPKVLGACQDSTRKFAGRRSRLAERLSEVAEKLARSWDGLVMDVSDMDPGSSLGIRPGSDDVMEPRREFARGFADEIGKLARNTPRDRRRKTVRLTAVESGGYQIMGVRS